MGGKHIFISGRVQGVGFRFHAHEKARELEIKGWVRNLTDGRVEVLAFGDPKAMETFVTWLSKGPPQAEVKELAQKDVKRKYQGEGFFIRRDGGPTWAED